MPWPRGVRVGHTTGGRKLVTLNGIELTFDEARAVAEELTLRADFQDRMPGTKTVNEIPRRVAVTESKAEERVPGFTCCKCKVRHASPGRDLSTVPEEERAKLRLEMQKAEKLYDEHPGQDSYERKYERAQMAYYSTLASGAWKFPTETMTTVRGPNGGGYAVVCLECAKV